MSKISKGVIIGIVALSLAVAAVSAVDSNSVVKAEEDGIAMYRVYNPYSGEHLYTKDENEKEWLVTIGWEFEGYSWVAANDGEPVYRFFNENSKEHLYTMNEDEKSYLISSGWNDEGIAWYSKTTGDACEVPVYRLFCPFTTDVLKSHHYTMNQSERDWLLSIGWNDEGTCWTSMHDIIAGESEEATCVHEGCDGGAVCTKCNRRYNATVLPKDSNNHIHTTIVPAVTKTIDRGVNLNLCSVFSCKMCGKELYRTGDDEITGMDEWETITLHLNSEHGFHYHSWDDVEAGIITEEQYISEGEEKRQYWSLEVVPGYYDSVGIIPEHTHCDDCGKDIY